MERVVEASGILILTRSTPQRILLLQHADRWDFPKGHVDEDEDLLAAALRETEEETGITSHQITVDDRFRHVIEYSIQSSKRGNYWKRVTYFLGYVESALPIQLTEHRGYQWLDWPVSEPIQAQTIDPLLQHVRQYLYASQ